MTLTRERLSVPDGVEPIARSGTARLECFAKINLTLRITGKLASEYHELCSLFYKTGPVDYLTINRSREDNVRVFFRGAPLSLEGRNILFKALDALRAENQSVPALSMILDKGVPPGTGLGAGSGDAAALLTWLENEGFSARRFAAEVGSDVSFLCGDAPLALARGRGERLSPVRHVPSLTVAVVIPDWRCRTPEMYREADLFYGSRWPLDPLDAEKEACATLRALNGGIARGLLPNDFAPVLLRRRPEYAALFEDFKRCGALAWGISGSGSSAFALWKTERYAGFDTRLPWVEDILIFPGKGELS